MSSPLAKPIDLAQLELTAWAFLQDELKRSGSGGVRQAHGYVIQHVLAGPRTIGELAGLLGVTQQAVSKNVAELERAGMLESVASADARARRLQLTAAGERGVRHARSARRKLERRLERRCTSAELETARRVLVSALEALGGTDAVKRRRVRPLTELSDWPRPPPVAATPALAARRSRPACRWSESMV